MKGLAVPVLVLVATLLAWPGSPVAAFAPPSALRTSGIAKTQTPHLPLHLPLPLLQSTAASTSTKESPGWLQKTTSVVRAATVPAGLSLAYYIYQNKAAIARSASPVLGGAGGDTSRVALLCYAILTQVVGLGNVVLRKLLGKSTTNNKQSNVAWFRMLIALQSIGLSIFSFSVNNTPLSKAMIAVSVAVGAFFVVKKEFMDGNQTDNVSVPPLLTLRYNEVVQLLAAHRLFKPILARSIWPTLPLLSKIPVSIGATVAAILPSALQTVGGGVEGEYVETSDEEGDQLAGFLMFLVSFFLLGGYLRAMVADGNTLLAAGRRGVGAAAAAAAGTTTAATGTATAASGVGVNGLISGAYYGISSFLSGLPLDFKLHVQST